MNVVFFVTEITYERFREDFVRFSCIPNASLDRNFFSFLKFATVPYYLTYIYHYNSKLIIEVNSDVQQSWPIGLECSSKKFS